MAREKVIDAQALADSCNCLIETGPLATMVFLAARQLQRWLIDHEVDSVGVMVTVTAGSMSLAIGEVGIWCSEVDSEESLNVPDLLKTYRAELLPLVTAVFERQPTPREGV